MFLHPLWFLDLTIVQLSVEDVSIEREIYKGHGYRLHAAKTSGKIVEMKDDQGNREREVSFTKITQPIITFIVTIFVEELLGSRQIQSEGYECWQPSS